MKQFLFFLFCIPQLLWAQSNWCGTSDKMIPSNPTIQEQNLMHKIRTTIANSSFNKSQDSLLIIPTVVHIIHFNGNGDITDLQVQDGMRVINEVDFSAYTDAELLAVHYELSVVGCARKNRFLIKEVTDPQNCWPGHTFFDCMS